MADAFVLRVKVLHLGVTKAVRFSKLQTVADAMASIADKCGIDESRAVLVSKYTLYIPGSMGGGTYLQNKEQLMSFYGLKDGAEVMLLPPPSSLTVISVDGQSTELRVEFQAPVRDVINRACQEFGYRMPENFEMHRVDRQDSFLLDPELTLCEQGVDSPSRILALKGKKRSAFNKVGKQILGSRSKDKKKNEDLTPGTSLNPEYVISEPMFVKTSRSDDAQEALDGEEVFGAPISSALVKDGRRVRKLPAIVSVAVEWVDKHALDVEGIYRVSAKSSAIDQMRAKVDSNLVEPTFPANIDPHVVTNLLKDPDADLSPILKSISADHMYMLGYLCAHLQRVQGLADKNKMSIDNLSRVFAPNILRRPDTDPDVMAIVRDTPKVTAIMTNLIINAAKYFPEFANSMGAPPKAGRHRPKPPGKVASPRTSTVDNRQQRVSSLAVLKNKGLPPPPAPGSDAKGYVRAEYQYQAQTEKEMDLEEGDIIKVLIMDSSGWWKGEVNGRRGFFPVTFCSEVAKTPEDLLLLSEDEDAEAELEALPGEEETAAEQHQSATEMNARHIPMALRSEIAAAVASKHALRKSGGGANAVAKQQQPQQQQSGAAEDAIDEEPSPSTSSGSVGAPSNTSSPPVRPARREESNAADSTTDLQSASSNTLEAVPEADGFFVPFSSGEEGASDSIRLMAMEAKINALMEQMALLKGELDAEKKARKHLEERLNRRFKKIQK